MIEGKVVAILILFLMILSLVFILSGNVQAGGGISLAAVIMCYGSIWLPKLLRCLEKCRETS
jgi:hypothetical protein